MEIVESSIISNDNAIIYLLKLELKSYKIPYLK